MLFNIGATNDPFFSKYANALLHELENGAEIISSLQIPCAYSNQSVHSLGVVQYIVYNAKGLMLDTLDEFKEPTKK